MDAHKLRGDYPRIGLSVQHKLTEHTIKILKEIDGQSRNKLPSELADEEHE